MKEQNEITPLYKKGEDKPALYHVPSTGGAYYTMEQAHYALNKPRLCECGAEISTKYYCICESCRQRKRAEEERLRFDQATKVNISDYQEDMVSYNDISDMGDFFNHCVEQMSYDEDLPKYVWGTVRNQIVVLYLDQILEDAECRGNPYEDYERRLDGVEELQTAVQAFNEANRDNHSNWVWNEDRKTAVILDEKFLEEVREIACR